MAAASLPSVSLPSTTRVLFGSCNKAEWEQPLWEPILTLKPDLWIWGGDNIYGDVPHSFGGFGAATPEHLRNLYTQQLAQPGYRQLLNSSVPIVGTWDDHDFGLNDGDRRYPYRNGSQEAFLDFIGEAPGSPRRQQRGVYTAQLFDFGNGVQSGRKVFVILMDMRYHRDPYGTPDGDFLGKDQWEWLENTLENSPADVHIIVSSLQFLADRTVAGKEVAGENWMRFPHARRRFLELLARQNVSAPIILSGDVHFAELDMGICKGGRLLEVTSSGMTHSWGTTQPCHPNPVVDRLGAAGMSLAMQVIPWRYQMVDASTGAGQYTLDLNFGELEFDWPARLVNVSIRGVGGVVKLHQSFPLAELGIYSEGIAGIEDFQPIRGAPEGWRVGLGVATLTACFTFPMLLVVAFCLLCARAVVRRAAREFGEEVDFDDDEDEDDEPEDTVSDSDAKFPLARR
mmetsp:Transcript_34459/g.109141  ORF Transcript_34459/g.109141 Transcript_34459/m.109141 type:complete len:456 (-) Transcript_34459:26-1393(-)